MGLSARPKGGGPGGHMPPEEAVSALKNKNPTFFTYYMILRVYTVMHNWERLLI